MTFLYIGLSVYIIGYIIYFINMLELEISYYKLVHYKNMISPFMFLMFECLFYPFFILYSWYLDIELNNEEEIEDKRYEI